MAHKVKSYSSYARLRNHVDRLQAKHGDCTLVYRGQRKFHDGKIIPTLQRETPGEDSHRNLNKWWRLALLVLGDISREYQQFLEKRRTVGHKGVKSSQDRKGEVGCPEPPKLGLNNLIAAVLQHYGARSNFVDVTKSLDIALWFAHHNHHLEKVPLLPFDQPSSLSPFDDFTPMPVYDVAWYEAGWTETKTKENWGYLFIFKPKPPREQQLNHGDLVNLSHWRIAARMMKQQAALIYVDPSDKDENLSGIIVEKIEIPIPLPGAPEPVLSPDARALFPSPASDPLYAKILSGIPFRQNVGRLWEQSRVIKVPEYYESYSNSYGSKDWENYRTQDLYVHPTLFFRFLASRRGDQLQCRLKGKTYHLRRSLPILTFVPSDMIGVEVPELGVEFQFEQIDPAVFLEYDSLQVTLPMMKEKYSLAFFEKGTITTQVFQWPNIRGVWIINYGAQLYWCRLFGMEPSDPEGKVFCSMGHSFQLAKGKEISLVGRKPRTGSEEAYHVKTERAALAHTLGILEDLTTGKRELVDSDSSEFSGYKLLAERQDSGWSILQTEPFTTAL